MFWILVLPVLLVLILFIRWWSQTSDQMAKDLDETHD